MKKLAWLIAVVFLMAGCGDKNNETPEPDGGLGSFAYNSELFFGTWKLSEVNLQPVMYQYSANITFNPTGFYIMTGDLGNEYGNFVFNDRYVICTSAEGVVKKLSVGWVKISSLQFNSTDFEIGTAFDFIRVI